MSKRVKIIQKDDIKMLLIGLAIIVGATLFLKTLDSFLLKKACLALPLDDYTHNRETVPGKCKEMQETGELFR